MGRRNPTLAECRAYRRKVLAALRVNRKELHRIVIWQGFIASGLDRERFEDLQRGFHAVQTLEYAAQDPPARRGFWVKLALDRAEQLDIRLG